MKKSNKLDFSSEKKKNNKRIKYFVIAFASFIIILGTLSLLMFMKSLDFDLKNLAASSDETTTEVSTETTTQEVKMVGTANILVICGNTDNNISFAFFVKADMPSRVIETAALPVDTVATANNTTATFNEHYQKFGTTGLVRAFEDYYGITIDRYVKLNESQFKSIAAKCGDVVVNVPQSINTNGLNLDAGQQSLSSDLLLRYIKAGSNDEKTDAFAASLGKVFSSDNINAFDKLYSYLANNSETSISIVDYKNNKDKLTSFINNKGNITANYDMNDFREVTNEKKD